MKTVVTGVAGFIGSHLAQRLLADGHEVVGIDCLTDYYDASIKHENLRALRRPTGFTFLEQDLRTMDLSGALDGADIVYHQAGQPGVRKSWGTDFPSYTRANIAATQRLLEACVDHSSLRRFVYASSSSVYGDATRYPTTEDTLPQPVSPYGVTKLAAEHLCTLYAKAFDVPTVSLRYFTVYGPGQRPDMAFTRFAMAAVSGGRIKVFGDGRQVRDFTFVEDVVRANILAGETDAVEGSVYNISGGTSASVRDVLDILGRIHGGPLDVEYTDRVPGDVLRTGGNADRALRELKWSPETDLRDGLTRQYAWAAARFAS